MTQQDIFDDMGRELAPKAGEIATVPEGWGIYPAITPEEYHLDPCPEPSMSATLSAPILDLTPADFAHQHPRLSEDPAAREATRAMARGDVVHQLTLGKGRGFAVGDFKDWRTKDAQNFKAEAIEKGLTPIKREDFDVAEALAQRLRDRIEEVLQGSPYETEVVFMWQEETRFGPVWCRGMADIWCPDMGVILDPKVTGLLYDGKIERQAAAMGWDVQCAAYKHGMGKIHPQLAGKIQFADILINPDPPHVTRLWAPDRAWQTSSLKRFQMACERFAACIARGEFPGFDSQVTYGVMPVWVDKARETFEIGFQP